jgi:hypothetical protein
VGVWFVGCGLWECGVKKIRSNHKTLKNLPLPHINKA